jgi:hypothetical protein
LKINTGNSFGEIVCALVKLQQTCFISARMVVHVLIATTYNIRSQTQGGIVDPNHDNILLF